MCLTLRALCVFLGCNYLTKSGCGGEERCQPSPGQIKLWFSCFTVIIKCRERERRKINSWTLSLWVSEDKLEQTYQMCVRGQIFYDLRDCETTAVFFHWFSTWLVSLCTLWRASASFRSQGQVDSSLKQIPALPAWVSRVYRLYQQPPPPPSPRGTIHPRHWHLLCPLPHTPFPPTSIRGQWAKNRRQWGQRLPALAGNVTKAGRTEWGGGLTGRG